MSGSDSTHIKNVASSSGDLRSYIMVVCYAWHFWDDKFWNGRNLDKPPHFLGPGIINRLNPFVGVGVNNLGDEYIIGFSFELARGVDIACGQQFAKIDILDGGYVEGDIFTGENGEIPTKKKWKINDPFWAISVDLRIATQLLKPVLGK